MIKTVLKVDGMMCAMCEAHVNEAIRKAVPTAKKVSSSHRKGMAELVTEEAVNEELLKQAVSATGYTCLSVESAEHRRRGLFG